MDSERIGNYLKQIVYNTRKRSSYTFVLSGNTSKIRTRFRPPLKLKGEYEIALVNLETWYSFPNVTEKNNKLRYSTDNGQTWYNIALPVGCYELRKMNMEIGKQMKLNGHYNISDNESFISIGANVATLKCILEIRHENYQLDLSVEDSIQSILGFKPQKYVKGYHISNDIVNILNINSIFVNLSVIKGSYVNGKEQPMLFSFFPAVAPGDKIIVNPKNLLYSRVITENITEIETWLTDQDGNLLDLRGETLTIRFHIRET